MKKSEFDVPLELPIPFRPSSNGEFEPPPANEQDRRAEVLYHRIVEEKSRRLGLTRRQFMESASGTAAALFVINQVYGCSGSPSGNGFSPDAGYDVPDNVTGRDAAQAAADARYDVSEEMLENQDAAAEAMTGDEFIFDVQTHNRIPAPPWNANICSPATDPMMCPLTWISEMFVHSDTDVACLSGYPASRADDQPSIQTRERIKEIVDRLSGSPRLVIHANVRPHDGMAELDAVSADAANFPVAAWKSYPEAMGLDAATAFFDRAAQTGIKIIAAHRGIGSDGGAWDGQYSPRDVIAAAKAHPDFKFLIYHSAWQSGVLEDHPFNAADPAPLGVDRLIKALRDNGIGPGGNVYAELGTTWFSLRTDMAQAAHVLGKLLTYLGPDRILWGTDSFNNGGPQVQIPTFRAFQIPESMQAMFGYPALTDEIKRKIFGLNAAAVYSIDVQAVRKQITGDDIAMIQLARRDDLRSIPRGLRPHGPRTRREFLAFLRWSGEKLA